MPLQIRRGPTADRVAFTPVEGELIFDTQSKSLYIGDGSTAGGIAAAGLTAADVRDSVGSLFADGTHDYITFTYDPVGETISTVVDLTTYDGTIQAAGFKGTVYGDDSTTLINSVNSSINLDGTVKGNVVPDTDEAYDLGSSSAKFRDLYLAGSSIYLGSANITATGTVVNLPAGSTVGGIVIGTGSGTGDGVIEGSTYKINIAADDSSIMVDTDSETVTASGGFVGSSIRVATIGTEDSSPLTVIHPTTFESFIDVNDDLTVSGRADITDLKVFNRADFELYSSTETNVIFFSKSRGSEGSEQIVQDGDILVNLNFRGWDGTQFRDSGRIISIVEGTPTSTAIPSSLIFQVSDSSGDVNTALALDSTSKASFLGEVDVINNDLNFNIWRDLTNTRALHFKRYRGTTILSSAVVQAGDYLGQFRFSGYDGADLIEAAQLRAEVDTAPSTGIVTGKFRFLVTNAAGTLTTAATIDSTNKTSFLGETENVNTEINSLAYRNATAGRSILFKRHRGTSTVPAIVQTGDYLGQIKFQGFDGSNLLDSAQVRGEVAGTPGVGIVSGQLRFLTANSSGVLTSAMTINSSQTVNIQNNLVVGNTTIPSTSIGVSGDVQGRVAFDSSYIYYCTAAYDGSTNIWKSVAWDVGSW